LLALVLVAAAPTAEETRQYRVAVATFDDKLYDVAERQLVEFLAKFPVSEKADNAQYLLARAQLNQGKWEQAVKSLEEAMARWPDRRPDAIRFWLGEAFARGGKFAEAESRYAEVVEKYPRSQYHAQALYGLAFVQMKQNKFDAAASRLDQLLRLGLKDELGQEAELLRGQIFLAQKKFDQADATFNAVAKKYPVSRAFYRAFYWLGESLARRQRYDEALKNYAVILDVFKAQPDKPVDAGLAAEAWYGEGWAYWETGKYRAAVEAFGLALANAQSTQLKRDALLKLAESSVRAGKVVEGVAQLREFLKVHPVSALGDQVQLGIADLLFGQDDYATALSEYTTLIAKYPNSSLLPKAHLQSGWCAWQLRQYEAALKSFQQALAIATDPSMIAEALEKTADAQFALGQYSDAIATYRRLIGSHPEAKSLDRALFQLGEAYRRIRDNEAATATFESLVKQFPKSEFAAEAQFNIGQILASQGKQTDARAIFAGVVEKFPNNVWARNASLAVGLSFQKEGQHNLAIAEFDKLTGNGLESELSQQAFFFRGECYAAAGKRDKTLADFTEFLKAQPAAALASEVSFWVGYEYFQEKDYLKAQAQFQSLAEAYPASKRADEAQYFAGRAAYNRQDYKTAIELYETVLKKFPDSSWRCDARFGEGDALSDLGQFDDSLLVFDSLVKQFPDCTLWCEAQGRKSDCQFTLGRYADAIATYERALDCAKDVALRAQLQFKIGQSYEKQGKLEDALQYYVKPLYVPPESTEPPERFWSCKSGRAAAAIKEQQQQWRDAITLYQKLAETCPDLKPLADDVIRKIRVQHAILF
jgi:TolA-binding protein